MSAWPTSFLSFGATVLTARTAMKLRQKQAGAVQRSTFRRLVGGLAKTSYWREAGVTADMPYAEFRARVAPRLNAALRPAIERMQQGEEDVLWPGRCTFFALTAGTATGSPTVCPVTPGMLEHFRAGCRDAALYYTARTGHAGVLRGRHLFLTGSTGLAPIAGRPGEQVFQGEWPAILALNLPRWADEQLFEPGHEISALPDWQAKLDAVITRTVGRDITLMAGIPTWVAGFAEQLKARRAEMGRPVETLQAIWPNLECLVHGGVPIAPYHADLRAMLGPDVRFHEVYAGVEGMYAAQDSADGALRVMADAGLFFEFLPLSDYDESRLEAIGERAVPLEGVQAGIDYVMLVTTPAGLARYVVGDIVRFTSIAPPRLVFVGRTALQLDAFGEKVQEREVTEALVAVCQRHRWSIVNFHVSPLFGMNLTGQSRGRHEWWIELKPGTVETPTGPQMAVEIDSELQRTSVPYRERRASGRIDSPTVRLVMPGVFRHWQRFHGRWGGQSKIARCRSDRQIADELAQITKFARDA